MGSANSHLQQSEQDLPEEHGCHPFPQSSIHGLHSNETAIERAAAEVLLLRKLRINRRQKKSIRLRFLKPVQAGRTSSAALSRQFSQPVELLYRLGKT